MSNIEDQRDSVAVAIMATKLEWNEEVKACVKQSMEMVARRLDQNPNTVTEPKVGILIENLKDVLTAYSNSNAELLAEMQDEDAKEG